MSIADLLRLVRTPRMLLRVLFIEKSNHGLIQFFRYGFVGGFSALVDIGALFACTSLLGIHYLISLAIAFILGTIVNYTLSILWVFDSSKNKKMEFLLFTLIGLGGLGINELIVWSLVEFAHLYYLPAKFVSVSVVVIWSFSLRRLLFARLSRGAVQAAAMSEAAE